MKLLVLGRDNQPDNQAICASAKTRGVDCALRHARDAIIKIFNKTTVTFKDLPWSPDIVLVRAIDPEFVSQTLALLIALDNTGSMVVDRSLVTQPYISNKTYQAIILNKAGLPTPKTTHSLSAEGFLKEVEQSSFPVVIKPTYGSHGKDVFLAQNSNSARTHGLSLNPGVPLIQSYLDAPHDYRVLVINENALGTVKRLPVKGDFRTNTGLDSKWEKCTLTKELKNLAEKAAQALNRFTSGVDIRSDSEGKLHILEVNRTPGFETFHETTGIDPIPTLLDALENLWQHRRS